ncbi:MAG: hypothetical protein GYA21_15315 [Myxococcales bacterium]|nr:hypothetical protein [Myxococcales bacterium]
MEDQGKKLVVLACSGASNTGAYSDLAARRLMAGGKGKMLCLARFAVDPKFAETSKRELETLGDDGELVILDGCPVNCAEEIMKKSGFMKYRHINTTDFGIIKGKTPVTEDKIGEIVKAVIH